MVALQLGWFVDAVSQMTACSWMQMKQNGQNHREKVCSDKENPRRKILAVTALFVTGRVHG